MSHYAGQLPVHFPFPLDQNRRPFARCDAYRFRRLDFRGVPCYVAEARRAAGAPLAARSPEILADTLAPCIRLPPAVITPTMEHRCRKSDSNVPSWSVAAEA